MRRVRGGRRWIAVGLSVLMVGTSVLVSVGPAEAIVGGTVGNRSDYPYFVAFPNFNGAAPSCDASVIGPGWVLTAAHCVKGTETATVNLLTGSADGVVIPHPLF